MIHIFICTDSTTVLCYSTLLLNISLQLLKNLFICSHLTYHFSVLMVSLGGQPLLRQIYFVRLEIILLRAEAALCQISGGFFLTHNLASDRERKVPLLSLVRATIERVPSSGELYWRGNLHCSTQWEFSQAFIFILWMCLFFAMPIGVAPEVAYLALSLHLSYIHPFYCIDLPLPSYVSGAS